MDLNGDNLLRLNNGKAVDSPPLQQVGGAPPPEVKGKFTHITPPPGVLDWGTTLTHLKEWFDLWQEWWGASWSGPENNTQLLALIRLKLSPEWKSALDNLDWTTVTVNQLYDFMDNKLNLTHPPLKRAMGLLPNLKKGGNKSYVQFYDCVKKALVTGGIGSWKIFNLNWDHLMVILVVKGVDQAAQIELLKKFDSFEISPENLNHFLSTMTTANSGNYSNVNTISKGSSTNKNSNKTSISLAVKAANPSASIKNGKCTRCSSNRPDHRLSVKKTGLCNSEFCGLCNRFFHSPSNCSTAQRAVNNVSYSANSVNPPPPSNPPPPPAPQQWTINALSCSVPTPTPRVPVSVIQYNELKGTTSCSLTADPLQISSPHLWLKGWI